MKISHRTHPRYQISCLHQQTSLLHRLSSTMMGLEYTCKEYSKEYSTPADPSPGYSGQVHDVLGCHPMVRTQGDGTRSPFVHQPPSLTGWSLSPPKHWLGGAFWVQTSPHGLDSGTASCGGTWCFSVRTQKPDLVPPKISISFIPYGVGA